MLLMTQRLLPFTEPALQLVPLRLGVREGLLQFANTLFGFALLLQLRRFVAGGRTAPVRPAGNCEQRSGGEAERQDVIECIEGIAAAHAEDK